MLLGETVDRRHIKASFSYEALEIVDIDIKKATENTYVVAEYIIVKVVDKATDNLDLLSEFKLDLTDTPQNK